MLFARARAIAQVESSCSSTPPNEGRKKLFGKLLVELVELPIIVIVMVSRGTNNNTRGETMGKRKSMNWYRVELVNYQTIGARCGYGEGRTLEAAQEDALRKAREQDPNAKLNASGYQVWFAGGVNC